MKKIILGLILLSATTINAQVVSTFFETTSFGISGLNKSDGLLYAVASDGKIYRKELTSNNNVYQTYTIGGSGYTSVCKVGNNVYVTKSANGLPGIYRFNITTNTNLEQFISINSLGGITAKGSDLYFSAGNKLYKIDVSTATTTPTIIAENILGYESFGGQTLGLKVYGNYLYFSETTGISRINLISGNYERETVTNFSGTSFALGSENMLYSTYARGGQDFTAVYQVDLQTQTRSLLCEIPNFIGTLDIVFDDNALYVTTREGDYHKVAKIDLNNLGIPKVKSAGFVIYPTFTDEMLNLAGTENVESVEIISQNGQAKTIKVEDNKINVSELVAGLYFIRIDNWVEKFVKR